MTNQTNANVTAMPAAATTAAATTTAATPAAAMTPEQAANAKKLLLRDIRVKWGKFSEQELTDLKSNDDLVTQLVAKYGLDKAAAQRDADAMRKGRNI